MKNPMIMIIAGEMSGDILAADLVRELKKKFPRASFFGVAGAAMKKEGVVSMFPMEELSLMGIVEVLPHLPKLFKRRDELVEEAIARRPDMLITVDAPDFSLRVAQKVKRAMNIPCIHYVSPSVWAWRQNRIFKMAKYLDHVLALFPFEPKIYEKADLPCTFVGHPLYERLKALIPKKGAVVPATDAPIAIVPGSRRGEISRVLPDLVAAFDIIKAQNKNAQAVLPLAHERLRKDVRAILGRRRDIKLVKGDQRFEALKPCRCALVCSGTANLELGMIGLPMVVVYKMSGLTHFIAKHLVDIPYISPVNWVLGTKAVPEFVQKEATAPAIAQAALQLIHSETAWAAQAESLANMRQALKGKRSTAAQNAASLIASYFPRSKSSKQDEFDF